MLGMIGGVDMKRMFHGIVASLLTLIALSNVASASAWTNYQPAAPTKLR